MRRIIKTLLAIMVLVTVVFVVGCHKELTESSIETLQLRDITSNSAVGGGTTTMKAMECGLCWSLDANPSIADEHIVAEATTGEFICKITGLEPNTTYHVRAYAIVDEGMEYGMDVSFTTLLSHDYVDLGLPSGTLWATCNVGATRPEEYGNYYGWAASVYDYPRYVLRYGDYVFYYSLTKYCNDPDYGYEGYYDTLTMIEPLDDAANICFGTGWHIPTYNEWAELVDCCTLAYTTQNEVAGVRFSSSNGNSVFLPAAGRVDLNVVDDITCGYYWSSMLYEENPMYAWCFRWNSINDEYGLKENCRHGRNLFSGATIRPVHSALKD